MKRPLPESPLVVSYGGGVDSTAILVEFARLHREDPDGGWRPDMIVHANVGDGNEHPLLYPALDVMDEWLGEVGFPRITRVRYYSPTTRYQSLLGNCLHNDVLPSLAYGGHSCSLKWKIQGIDDFVWGVRGWEPAYSALAEGRKVVRVIGYDAGCADTRRFAKMDKQAEAGAARGEWSPWHNWYPLRDWGWTREECTRAIEGCLPLSDRLLATIGQRCVRKSACWFCPAMKVAEVEDLARECPDLALQAAALEYRAETGKHGLTSVNGLGLGTGPKHPWDLERTDGGKGRNWSWWRHLRHLGILPADWQAQARAAGYIPEGWNEYSERCRPIREDVLRLKALVREEAERLPEEYRETALKGKEAAKLALDGIPACHYWSEARHSLKGVEKRRKALLPPDWSCIPKPVPTPEVKARRKAAKARWRAACSEAQRIEAERIAQQAEAPVDACVVEPELDADRWIVYDGSSRAYLFFDKTTPSPQAAQRFLGLDAAAKAARAKLAALPESILIRDPLGPRELMVWYDAETDDWPRPEEEENDA
jgi:hypothetical protein